MCVISLGPRITALMGFTSVSSSPKWGSVDRKHCWWSFFFFWEDGNLNIQALKILKDSKAGNTFPLMEGFRSNFKKKGGGRKGNFLLPNNITFPQLFWEQEFISFNLFLAPKWNLLFSKGLRNCVYTEEENTYLISWWQKLAFPPTLPFQEELKLFHLNSEAPS